MKKIAYSTMLTILASSFILTSNIKVQAVTTNLDFNNNGVVDTTDLGTLATNYNLKSGDNNWDSKYDLNGDNVVDVFDLVKISKSIQLPNNTDVKTYTSSDYFKSEYINMKIIDNQKINIKGKASLDKTDFLFYLVDKDDSSIIEEFRAINVDGTYDETFLLSPIVKDGDYKLSVFLKSLTVKSSIHI